MRWLPVGLIGLVGCASGGKPDVTPVDSGRPTDATQVTIDGSPADAPAVTTLTQTTCQLLKPAASIACPATTSGTAANNYYRVFDLAALGITTDFMVTSVSFQSSTAISSAALAARPSRCASARTAARQAPSSRSRT